MLIPMSFTAPSVFKTVIEVVLLNSPFSYLNLYQYVKGHLISILKSNAKIQTFSDIPKFIFLKNVNSLVIGCKLVSSHDEIFYKTNIESIKYSTLTYHFCGKLRSTEPTFSLL